jgi:hypothetical protein
MDRSIAIAIDQRCYYNGRKRPRMIIVSRYRDHIAWNCHELCMLSEHSSRLEDSYRKRFHWSVCLIVLNSSAMMQQLEYDAEDNTNSPPCPQCFQGFRACVLSILCVFVISLALWTDALSKSDMYRWGYSSMYLGAGQLDFEVTYRSILDESVRDNDIR